MKRYALSVASGVGILMFSVSSFAADGFYLGLGTTYNAINSDFDGSGAYNLSSNDPGNAVPSTLIVVPKIDGAFGWLVLAGYQRGNAAIELNYARSRHGSRWNDIPFDTEDNVVDLDLKYFFINLHPLHPYGLVGVNFDQIKIKRGAANTLGTDDVKYYGGGFNLGLGADYFITDHVSFGLNAKYRLVRYNEAIAVSNHWQLDHDLSGNGYSVTLTTAYRW